MKIFIPITIISLAISLIAAADPIGICLHAYSPEAPPDKIECFEFEKSETMFQGKRYFLKNGQPVVITDYKNRGVILYPKNPTVDSAHTLEVYETQARQIPSTRQFLNPWILKLRNSLAETSKQAEAASKLPDLTTTDGKSYIGITITKVEPDGIRIMHQSGSAKIPFEKLSESLRAKYGYDVAKATEFRRIQEAKDQAAEKALDASISKSGTADADAQSTPSRSTSNSGGNLGRSGVWTDSGPVGNVEISGSVVTSKPFYKSVAVTDGICYYVEAGSTYIVAANKGGGTLWRYDTGTFGLDPCVYNDFVISASMQGKITALDRKTGDLKWDNLPKDKDSMIAGQPAVFKDTVYAGYLSGELAALDVNSGKKIWSQNFDGAIIGEIAVADDLIYVCANPTDATLYAVNVNNGEEKWRFKFKGIPKQPMVSDGNVYLMVTEIVAREGKPEKRGTLIKIDAKTGKLKSSWNQMYGYISGGSAVSNGVVYFGAEDGLYAVQSDTGKVKWKHAADQPIERAPSISSGCIYYGGGDGFLYALNLADGTESWRCEINKEEPIKPIKSTPTIAGGAVYIGGERGIFKVSSKSSLGAKVHEMGRRALAAPIPESEGFAPDLKGNPATDSPLDKLPEAIAIAATGGQFDTNIDYQFTGPVIQATEQFILVQNLATNQPLGALVFGNPEKVNKVAMDKGTMIQAKIRFNRFKTVTVVGGTQERMAVFDCLGIMPIGQKYIDTSAPVVPKE